MSQFLRDFLPTLLFLFFGDFRCVVSLFIIIRVIVYAHGRRLCSNLVRHGSITISYPQCSLTFMREPYLHSCHEQSFAIRADAISAVGINVVRVHKLFAYRALSTVGTDIVSSHTKYCRIAYGITKQHCKV